ncbi:MAG TPA: uroporphyrinogen-III synthase [Vicinamibacterales bacterium]|nr:uroporphyrinogen-III synthase [Vicinamibacterales bacterium]
MHRLDGRTVALLESRKAGELAALVERFGGTPLSVPSVREVLREDDFVPLLGRLVNGGFDMVVVLTAAACEALFAEAERHGLLDGVVSALAGLTLVARGPKPLLPLRKRGLVAGVVTGKPHTTDELLEALAGTSLRSARVLLLHYGERNDSFSRALAERGAQIEDLSLYEWALPETLAPLHALIDATVGGRIDAMLFTSQIQFRHLLQVAFDTGRDGELTRALRDQVIVGSVGPVCTRAMRAAGVVPDVMPHLPNGPSLVQALADYYAMFTSEETSS